MQYHEIPFIRSVSVGLWTIILAGPFFQQSNFGAIDYSDRVERHSLFPIFYVALFFSAAFLWLSSKFANLPEKQKALRRSMLFHLPIFACPTFAILVYVFYIVAGHT